MTARFCQDDCLTLAEIIGCDSLRFENVLLKCATGDAYTSFSLRKRSGGHRSISVPNRELKSIQRSIIKTVLNERLIHSAVHSYRINRSVATNAASHLNSEVVVHLDLKDFFGSVTYDMVTDVFMRLGNTRGCAEVLAQLTTKPQGTSRVLPQGSPTSPVLSNLAASRLDERLCNLAGYRYTRYSDDLVFSTTDKELVKTFGLTKLIRSASLLAEFEGFRVNEAKTRVMFRQHRQVVTGVIVNGTEPRISRSDLRKFRAFLHRCETQGVKTVSDIDSKDALAYANGYLSFIAMVNPNQAGRIWSSHQWLRRPKKSVYPA